MCAENIFVDELSIEPCQGAEWFGKNHAVRLCGRDQK